LKRGNVVPSRGWGITLLNERFELQEHAATNVPEGFLARYEREGTSIDPILPLVLQRQSPVHNLDVASLEEWRRHPLFHDVMSPFGFEHVLFAPVVSDGKIVMTLHFGRGHSEHPFGTEEVLAAAALANHVSALMGRIARGGDLPELAEWSRNGQERHGRRPMAGRGAQPATPCPGRWTYDIRGGPIQFR